MNSAGVGLNMDLFCQGRAMYACVDMGLLSNTWEEDKEKRGSKTRL